MLGSIGIRAGAGIGDWMAGSRRAAHDRLRQMGLDALRISPRQWAGRAGWLMGAGYAATVIVWAVMRYGG